jgi:hypothetical protein
MYVFSVVTSTTLKYNSIVAACSVCHKFLLTLHQFSTEDFLCAREIVMNRYFSNQDREGVESLETSLFNVTLHEHWNVRVM